MGVSRRFSRRSRSLWLTLVVAAPALIALPAAISGAPAPDDARGSGHAKFTSVGHVRPGKKHASGDTPNIHIDRDAGVMRVDAPTGAVWLLEASVCGLGAEAPYPGCLVCHCELENPTINMFDFALDCTWCHGGDPFALTKGAAHVRPNGNVVYDKTVPPLDDDLAYQQFVNPTNLRVVEETCGLCHSTQVSEINKSMMATAAGHYAGGLYQNNVVDTKTPVYGTFAVEDTDGYVPEDQGAVQSLEDLIIYTGGDPNLVATHFAAVPSQGCARCHLWSRGKGYRGAEGADGVYRADGCAACHMLYADDGLSRSADPTIDHAEPGHPIQHVVTREIPTDQCLHCHHRGARIGLSFTGRAQMPPDLPSGPGVPGTSDVKFNGNYHYTVDEVNPEDIHGQVGMHCIDCHVQSEVMGDGNIYGHMDQATKIECRTCHGTPNEAPTLLDNDGVPLPNVAIEMPNDPGNERPPDVVVLTSEVTGARHLVPLASDAVARNPKAACAMNDNHIKAEGGLECYACHAAWVPNCFGCHFERDEQHLGLNLMTREYEVGRVRTNNKVFESLRHFSLGPNSEGRVAPYLVACQPIADVTAPNGEKILDMVMPVTSNGLSGLAINPVNPHTTRGPGNVRSCAECHRSPPSLGFGSGNYAIARDRVYTAGADGVNYYDRGADPDEPDPEGTLPVIGAARALATLPNVVEGTVDFLYVAQGADGLAIFDRRPGGPTPPVATIGGIDAIDVSRVARYLYVVDAGVGVHIYDNEDPTAATLVTTVPIPTAVRAVPWGIHLFVAAGPEGLVVVNIADHDAPYITGSVPSILAADVELYAHFQGGADFAARAYVADPTHGVWIVDLLPDFEVPHLVDDIALPGAAGLDAYTRYVLATDTVPSLEHDYLYVAAGAAGLHVFDMTDPDSILEVAAVTDLGGSVADVVVSSHLDPPGTDDYAILANEALGLQVVLVNDPHDPVNLGSVPDSSPASRVLVEVQQMDRFLDEQAGQLKENSHPFTEIFTREDIVRILAVSIDCDPGAAPTADLDGDGLVGPGDLIAIMLAWGTSDPAADLDGDGTVGFGDLLAALERWGDLT